MALSRFFPARALSVMAACLVFAAAPAMANEVQDINVQFRNGDLSGALARANSYLVKNPKDAQVRFLKGLILADQGKTNDAIALFTDLTQDYPELPEPYNNLAVLYASQSKYEAAKNALEMAIRTHPSYATAHENLGDIYAKMASIAYDKALALDNKNTAAQTKLALIKDMIGGAAPRKSAATKTPVVAIAKPVPKPTAKPTPQAVATDSNSTAVESAILAWAQAWSRRDVDAYLASYSADFKSSGLTRPQWEAQRRARISAPKSIEVKVSDLDIAQQGDTASAIFRQTYTSDRLSSTVTKTLKLTLQNDQWRIVSESAK